MLRHRHWSLACGLAACLVALSPAAPAGTFSISPLRVDLSSSTKTAALTVRNEDATEVVVQADGMAWSQPGGEDTLVATRDLLVSPAVFTLAPGAQQLVRVALRRAPDPARELSYRLIIQEVPQAAAPITRASKRSARWRAELRRASFASPIATCSSRMGYDIAAAPPRSPIRLSPAGAGRLDLDQPMPEDIDPDHGRRSPDAASRAMRQHWKDESG